MNWFKKSSSLRDTSALGILCCLVSPAYGLQETYESRALVLNQHLIVSNVDSIKLQQQALLATTALNGDTSTNTLVTLPQAVSEVKSNLGLATSTPVTQYVDELRNALGGAGGLYENAQAINGVLDGVQSLIGLSSFVVSTPATHVSNIVNIIGDDGVANQTYSFTYSFPILSGDSIILSNGGKSITFINNSGVTLSSANALATYLAGAYPLNFRVASTTTAKISAISDLLGGVSGGASGTNTSLYGQAITALSSGPTNDVVNNILDGIQEMSGLTTFTVTAAAILSGSTVIVVGHDGAPTQSYSLVPTLPITTSSPFTLSNGGKTITFINNSGGNITSANDLASYLANAYPIHAILKGDSNAKAEALENVIGGANYSAMSNAMALNTMLLPTPTGVLLTDVQSLNSAVDGNASGSTVKGRLNSVFGVIDGSNGSSGNITNKLNTQITSIEGSATQLSTAIGNVNSAVDGNASGSTVKGRLNSVFGAIDGSNGSSGNITNKLNTQITSIEGSATQLSTAISNVKGSLGGSGTILDRVNHTNSSLDGVQSMAGLSSFTVTAAANLTATTITMSGNDGGGINQYSINTASINLGDGTGGTTPISTIDLITLTSSMSGNTITFANNSGGSITSAAALTDYLASAYPINTVFKLNTSSKVTALKSVIGGSDYSALNNAIGNNILLDGGSSNLSTQAIIGSPTIGASPSDIVSVIGGTPGTSIATLLGDPGSGHTLLSNIDGGASDIQSALNSVSTIMMGNTNFSSPLVTQLTSQSATLDNGVYSLPGATYGVISSAAVSDGSGGVNIGIGTGFGAAAGLYNLSAGTIAMGGGISSNSFFSLDYNGYNLKLYNRSGSTISTQSQALLYLQSMYPVNFKLTTNVSDKISNLSLKIGGTLNSITPRIAAIDRAILDVPTGVLLTDLSVLRNKIVSSLGATAESDVNTVSAIIDGTTSSALDTKLGLPTISSTSSNLSTVIGGSGSDLAERLGDPVTAGTGLSSLIKASSASDGNTLWNGDISGFTSATDLSSQLQQFLALFNTNNWTNTGHTTITFTCSGSTPNSIADLINMATSTS